MFGMILLSRKNRHEIISGGFYTKKIIKEL